MFLKTNIPETTLSLVSNGVDFGDRMFDQPILADRTNQIQAIVTGNRCGHVPESPRPYLRPVHHNARPSILEEALSKVTECFYHKPKKYLQKLWQLSVALRQQRSERREAIASVLQVVFHFVELETLRVGFFTPDGEFISLDLKYIAGKAGISVIRAKRAMDDLISAGYVESTRQRKKNEDGTFSSLPSIRIVKPSLFMDLGLDMVQLNFLREWKRKRNEKAAVKKSRKRIGEIFRTAGTYTKNIVTKTKNLFRPKDTDKKVEQKKALISEALALHRLNPAKTVGDYLVELQRKLE
jgi:hypothetical protein